MENPTSQNHHITQTVLHDFAAGSLTPEEFDAVACHIEGCEQCAMALAEILEAGQHAKAPEGFEEEILSRISHLKQKKTEFFYFSLRVAFAACIALFFVFSNILNTFCDSRKQIAKIKAPSFSAVENIDTHLRNFSQQILEMEVFNNVEKAK